MVSKKIVNRTMTKQIFSPETEVKYFLNDKKLYILQNINHKNSFTYTSL